GDEISHRVMAAAGQGPHMVDVDTVVLGEGEIAPKAGVGAELLPPCVDVGGGELLECGGALAGAAAATVLAVAVTVGGVVLTFAVPVGLVPGAGVLALTVPVGLTPGAVVLSTAVPVGLEPGAVVLALAGPTVRAAA